MAFPVHPRHSSVPPHDASDPVPRDAGGTSGALAASGRARPVPAPPPSPPGLAARPGGRAAEEPDPSGPPDPRRATAAARRGPGGAPCRPAAAERAEAAPPAGCGPHATTVPRPGGVPPFPPVRVRAGARRLRRAVGRQRRAAAAGLAVTAAALAASAVGRADDPGGRLARDVPAAAALAAAPAEGRQPGGELVSAPVRIADAAAVRLLRPGDLVDVIAAPGSSGGPDARAEVVASCVRVDRVPALAGEGSSGEGALVVLSVSRKVAQALAGAGASAPLVVAVC
ncbi:hypothetical protein GCM10023329_52730 [Streptomyces sanyensis]|uniref:Flp pilus assembly protein RcpC/CpaB domain-containing protein n=1 Tax=Streptomyces sanyensis TaxID=568869 RepID=A0ABP9BCZ6_9ACTN